MSYIHTIPFIIWLFPILFLSIMLIKPVQRLLISDIPNAHITETAARALISSLVLTLPFAFDRYVPEVSGDIRWYIMHASAGLLAALFATKAFVKPNKEKFTLNWTVAQWATAVIFILTLLTTVWSISPALSFWFMKHSLAYIIIFYAIVALRNDDWYKKLALIFTFGVGFHGLIGIFQFLNITDAHIASAIPFLDTLLFVDYFRQSAPPGGTMANKNLAASFLVLTLPLTLYALLTSKHKWLQIAATVCFTLGTTLLLYTRSRGSWISAVAGILFFVLWLILNKPQRTAIKAEFNKFKAILLGLSLVTTLAFAQLESGHDRYSIRNSISEQTASIFKMSEGDMGARMAYNLNGLAIIAENPLGTGPSTFHTIYPKYNKAVVQTPAYGYNLGARPRRAHNDLMQTFIELGVLGGLTHLVLFGSMLVMAWRTAKHEKVTTEIKTYNAALITGIFGLSINALGDFPLQMPMAPFALWSMMALLTGLYLQHTQPKLKALTLPFKVPHKLYIIPFVAFIALTGWVSYDNAQRRTSAIFLKQAMSLSYSGMNNDYALRAAQQAYSYYPNNSRLVEIRAVIFAAHGQSKPHNIQVTPQQSADALMVHLKHDPYAQNSLINIGYKLIDSAREHAKQGNQEKAQENLRLAHHFAERAVEVASHEGLAYSLHGITSSTVGNMQQALESYGKALKADPTNPVALNGRARLLALIEKQKAQQQQSYK